MLKTLISLTAVGLIALNSVVSALPSDDQVTILDQMPDLSFGFFSGYLPINGTQKELHYVAALSQNDFLADPVIIWFNGGPGCSSLLGWATEHGPYVIEDGTSNFVKNEHSWNKEATVIYIESPAGVGFSKCPDYTECKFTDFNSADDNLMAVLNLFTMKFPDLQKNDLYISGESYAGLYVPFLAQRIDHYNTENAGKGVYLPNLKGFMVGNGVTDWKFDTTPAFFEMAYLHNLIPPTLYNNIKKNCDLSYYGFDYGKQSYQCIEWMWQFDTLTSAVNIYDVYGKCYSANGNSGFALYDTLQSTGLTKVGNELKTYKKYFTSQDYTPFLARGKAQPDHKHLQLVPPCVYASPLLTYLNNQTNRYNLNIPDDVQSWDLCSNIHYSNQRNGSIDIYRELKGKYKILIFSGDTDGAVPTYGTQQWIAELGWDVKNQWQGYYIEGQNEVAGYVETRDDGKFVFATVHGAGHMAAQWKRPQTYHVVFNFINDKQIW